MAKTTKWNAEDRKRLFKMVQDGVPEQEIREALSSDGKGMTSTEFAQQLRLAMVEAGKIKQAPAKKGKPAPTVYEVTPKGRLTVTDFSELTGFEPGSKFVVEKPRGRSKAWRIVPYES